MARAEVFSGVCGHRVEVEATRLDRKHVQVELHTDCEMCLAMNPELANLQVGGRGHQVFRRITDSAIYQSASRHLRHPGCVVPAAIIKTIEVEIGAALPKDVTIKIEK
ncbi:MAG: hypothetical protein ACE5H9_22135 [Anaerolineae bacterium]